MRLEFRVRRVASFIPSLATMLLAALIVGCDSGSSMNPEDAQKHAEAQKATVAKGVEDANAEIKKNSKGKDAPTVKMLGKPGAVGRPG